jgi:hypothetical protein
LASKNFELFASLASALKILIPPLISGIISFKTAAKYAHELYVLVWPMAFLSLKTWTTFKQ